MIRKRDGRFQFASPSDCSSLDEPMRRSGALTRPAVLFLTIVSASLSHPLVAQNLIPDPMFSTGISAWRTGPLGPVSLERIPSPGSDGAAGFAKLTAINGGPGSFEASVCVPVQAGVTYSWGGFLRFVAPPEASVSLRVIFREEDGCSGLVLPPEGVVTPALVGSNADVWQFEPGADVIAPTGALSATFEVSMGCGPCGPFSVDFDNVYFGPRGTGPPLAASVPTLGDAGLLLLGICLAVVGVWNLVTARA